MQPLTRLAALVAIVLVAGTASLVRAQTGGYPDLSFGPNGIAALPSFGVSQISAIGIQHIAGEERIVALGPTNAWKFARYRFAEQGLALDTSFGVGGYVSPPVQGAMAHYGMVVQPDNKLVVVGGGKVTRQTGGPLMVARYTENGALDSSFGARGVVTLSGYQGASTPRLQSDGKIVLAIAVGMTDTHVIRLNANGTFDVGFGTNGVAVLAGVGYARAAAVQPVGSEERIVVSTVVHVPIASDPDHYVASLVRLDPSGGLDTAFGGGAAPLLDVGPHGTDPTDLAIDAWDRIVVGGSADYKVAGVYQYNPVVARYDLGGVLDPSFGNAGVSTLAEPSVATENIAIGPDGRILVVGVPMPTYPNSRGLAVWCLQENGSPDSSFGQNAGLMFSITTDPFTSMWTFGPGPVIAFTNGGSRFLVGGSAYVAQSKRVVTAAGAIGRFVY